jgi:hypothetical protein
VAQRSTEFRPEAKICLIGIESADPTVTVGDALIVSKEMQLHFFVLVILYVKKKP